MATKQIKGAEIFAEGSWNGLSFSERDLDGIVSSFDAMGLSGRVPLKLGHEGPDARDNPESQYAFGWVTRVWREGKKLLADLDIPEKVHTLISDGFLNFVSVELLKDVKVSTRNIPWVLDAVALLGADQPAVGILKDLKALTMARDFKFASRVAFSRADHVPFKSTNSQGEHRHMSNDNQDLATVVRELTEKVAAMSNQINETQSENRELKRVNTELTQIKGRFERSQEERQQERVDARRKEVRDRLEAAVKAQDILPAARERFNKVYRVEDDEAVMTIDLADVEEFIKENPNTQKPKPKRKSFTALNDPDGDVPDDVSVDQEALLRTNALLMKRGVMNPTAAELQQAAVQVFRSNPDLAARYKAASDAQYGK